MKRLSLMLIFSLIFVSLLSYSSAETLPEDSLANFLPSETSGFFALNDFQGSKSRIKELALYKLVTAEFADTIIKSVSEHYITYSEITRIQESALAFIKNLTPIFDNLKKIEFGVIIDENPDDNFSPFAISMNFGNIPEEIIINRIRKVLTDLPGKISDFLDEYISFKLELIEEEHFGLKTYKISKILDENAPEEEDLEQYLFFKNGNLLCVSTDKLLQEITGKMLKATNDSLATNGSFLNCYTMENGKDLFSYINTDLVSEIDEDPLFEQISQFTDTISGSASLVETELEDSLTVYSQMLSELPALPVFSEMRVRLEYARLLPNDPYAFVAMNLPPFEAYTQLLPLFEPIKEIDQMAEDMLHVSLINDILPLIGSEFGIYYKPLGVSQSILAAIEVVDTETLKGILDQITDAEDLKVLKKSTFREYDIYRILPSPKMFPIAMTIKDNYLLVGTIQALKKAIRITDNTSLASNQSFMSAVSHYENNGSNLLIYCDTEKMASFGWSIAQYSMNRNYWDENGDLETLLLPSSQEITEFLTDQTISIKVHPDRLHLRTKGPLGLLSISQLIPPIAIPSFLNARRNSNQNAALATCKNFSTASVDFAANSEEQYYWEDGTTDFKNYFSHIATKSSFNFRYFSNDRNGNGKHEATAFIYIAVPVSYASGRKACFVDETGQMYKAELTEEEIIKLNALKSEDIDWEKTGVERLKKMGVEFNRM